MAFGSKLTRLRSLRWRLPSSYAALALLGVLSLGAALRATGREYYANQECAYLQANAQAFSTKIANALRAGVPMDTAAAQIETFAFFSRMRVRLYDANNQLIADSGLPDQPRLRRVYQQPVPIPQMDIFQYEITPEPRGVAIIHRPDLCLSATSTAPARRVVEGDLPRLVPELWAQAA